ncbi:YciI family protein [Herbaspirillum rhizosphaerae]|uniref:YciI family protein n=1 Tax=Herbaspirillum rhizosphaerae TaxID=346179 RepID=A0ABW8ZCL9_9BURK
MKFINYVAYTDDREKLAAHAPDHQRYMKSLLDAGKLSLGGPFSDGSGGLIIYEVATKEEAEALRDQDPFAISCVFVRSEIKPWLLLAINPVLVTQD